MFAKELVPLYAALVTASAASLVSVVALAGAYFSEKRLRRRTLYGDAYRSALAWLEMVGRVRRRRSGEEFDAELVERFHKLQEEILYHTGWIGSESRFMRRSYDSLVRDVKFRSSDLIREAWSEGSTGGIGRSLQGSQFPDASESAERFLHDVRSHLSPLQIPKIAVMWRNRKRQ